MYFFSKQKSISVWSVSNWLEYPFFGGETTRILSPHGPLVVIDKSVAVSKIFSFSCRVSSPSPFLPLSLSLLIFTASRLFSPPAINPGCLFLSLPAHLKDVYKPRQPNGGPLNGYRLDKSIWDLMLGPHS